MSTILPFIVQLISIVLTPQEVSLVFAGDAMQHQGQLDAARRPDGSYGYDGCFDAVAPYISAADYAVVNLETTLGAGGFTGYPCFCSPDSYAEALRDAGFDMMLTANNHTLDRLDKGLHRTISVLDSLGVDHLGTYHDGESRQRTLPMVKDIKGIKIGFLNYTYGTNGLTVKGDAVVDYIDTDLMASDIESARAAGAEILAVAVHWGVEYKLLPHPSQKALADFLVGQGVDLIIGGHPHVIQPMEVRHSEKYGKDVLLVYSLGNFISNMKTTDTRGGAIVKAVLRRGDDGVARFANASYSLVFTVPPAGGVSGYRLYPAMSDGIPASWRDRCRAFTSSAERIFTRHNISVPRDTVGIR